jgi:hypothetical protein
MIQIKNESAAGRELGPLVARVPKATEGAVASRSAA